jgi:mRNA-degrading endonuclease RelE of RelBE toxin-antitoxin system
MSARWQIRFTKQARKDVESLPPKLKAKLRVILVEIIARNPYEGKKLLGDLAGSYAYRLSYKDRIVYSLDEERRTIYIERARTHYGE